MLEQFCYKVYLPSLDRYEYYKELTNKEYLCIIKYGTNNDDVGLSRYLEHLITHLQINKTYNHTRLDKFCVLYTMFAVCIKSVVTMNVTCEETKKDYTIDIDVFNILNVISNLEGADSSKVINDSGNMYTVELPDDLYNERQSVKASDILKSIDVNGDIHDLSSYTDKQKQQILTTLPGSSVSRIMKFVNDYESSCVDAVYLTYRSPYVENDIPYEYTVNLLNNELFQTFKNISITDLKSFYEMSHGMSSNFKLSHEHYLNITPAETRIYYDLMKNEVEQQKKQAESSNSTGIENPVPGV